MASLAETQTLKGIYTSRHGLHQTVKNDIDVPTAAAICAHAFAHEVVLTWYADRVKMEIADDGCLRHF
jgi:hypothetical protein